MEQLDTRAMFSETMKVFGELEDQCKSELGRLYAENRLYKDENESLKAKLGVFEETAKSLKEQLDSPQFDRGTAWVFYSLVAAFVVIGGIVIYRMM